jgi:putative redox protein
VIRVERIDSAKTAHRVTVRAHELTSDMAVAAGGADAGPDPHDFYDSALGACKALTMVWYAQRNAIPLEDVQVDVVRDATQERSGAYRLTTTVTLTGDLTDDQRARLLDVAAKCPLHKLMTAVTTEIETQLAPR